MGYIAVTYRYSLCGNEGFMVDADALIEARDSGKDPNDLSKRHIVIPILDQFIKSEVEEQ